MNKSHSLKKRLIYFLLFLLIIFALPFIVLKIGFSIPVLESKKISVEQLYIKLDKKIIIRAKKLSFLQDIEQKNSENFAKDLLFYVEKLDLFFTFFEEVSVENVEFLGYKFRLLFTKEELLLEDDSFLLKFSIRQEQNNILANVNEFRFKDHNISTSSSLLVKTDENSYDMNGSISSDLVSFEYFFAVSDKELSFYITDLYSERIKELFSTISSYVDLDKDLLEWLSAKAVARQYYVDNFKIVLSKKLLLGYDIKHLEAKARVKDFNLLLNEGVDSILIPNLDLNLSKERLDFYFEKASFNAKDISSSKVFIYDITDPKKAGISLRILSNELSLNKALHRLLQSYDIRLPFSQHSGFVRTDFSIKIPFQADKKINYSAKFSLRSVQSDLLNFFVKEGMLFIDNNKISLKNFLVSNSFLNASFDARLDSTRQEGFFDVNVQNLHFDEILDMRDKNLSLALRYKNGVFLDIKDFNLSLDLSKGIEFTNSNMIALKPYSPLLKNFNISNIENFWLKSSDFKDFDISLEGLSFANKNIYAKDSFYIKKINDDISINNKDKSLEAKLAKNDINIRLDNFSFILDDINSSYNKDISYNIKAQGKDIGLLFSDFNKSLSFDNANLYLSQSKLRLNAQKASSSFYLDKDKDKIYLSINGVNDRILNDFFAKEYFKSGTFFLLMEGKNFDDLNGTISIRKTYIKDLKFQNQLMSFIDTVPSLLLFKTPTFNNEGLDVQNGAIIFDKKYKKINIKTLALDGDTVDILGVGDINLKDDSINMKLELKILKSASQIIANIPIINQVILGKDRDISTSILVDGSINDPKFHTQMVKETLKLPFDLIKNIIEIPSTWFN